MNKRISVKSSKHTLYIIHTILYATLDLAILGGSFYFGSKLDNTMVFIGSGVFIALILSVCAIDGLYKAFNTVKVGEDYVKVCPSPFMDILGGDITIRRNKNRTLEIHDKLHITHSFGLTDPEIGDTYLILSNYPIGEDYTVDNDENAVVTFYSEEFVEILKKRFDCVEVNNLRKIVEEKGLYRITTTPQGERYKEKKIVLRTDDYIYLSVFILVLTGIMIPGISYDKNDIFDRILAIVSVTGILVFLSYGFGYYVVTKDEIINRLFPFIPIGKIVYSDYAEIGIFTYTKQFANKHGRIETSYQDFIYFSTRVLTDDERDDMEKMKSDCKLLIYNEIIHKYLTDTLGIDVRGKLIERK